MECAVVIIDNKRDCVEIRAITDADAIRHAASHVSWTEMDRDPNYGPPPEFDETDHEQQVEDLAIAIG
jgi:hypothetical protein